MAKRIDVTLEGLHQLLGRMERKELQEGDWAICIALMLDLILRKSRGSRIGLVAKLAAQGAGVPAKAQVVDGQMVLAGDSPALGAGGEAQATQESEATAVAGAE